MFLITNNVLREAKRGSTDMSSKDKTWIQVNQSRWNDCVHLRQLYILQLVTCLPDQTHRPSYRYIICKDEKIRWPQEKQLSFSNNIKRLRSLAANLIGPSYHKFSLENRNLNFLHTICYFLTFTKQQPAFAHEQCKADRHKITLNF